MKQPLYITFTGVDDRTNLNNILLISDLYKKKVEWGILVSLTNKDSRYPSIQGMAEIVSFMINKNLPYAIHLCGRAARENAWENDYVLETALMNATTIQINGNPPAQFSYRINHNFVKPKVVLQTKTGFDHNLYHELYDCSGGKGIVPDHIPELPNDRELVGYAGGIGPDTVEDYIKKINANEGKANYWLDMESSLRKDGWFDIQAVAEVLKTVYGRVS